MAVPMKYVLVSGGVISGIGKGLTASSLGVLLKACGWRVTSIKIDPYINIDAGTMSPLEHGEVFVLDDGGEVDLDLGNYERFLGIHLTRQNNITTGKIYQQVIERERRGDYLGKTVQVVPHVTDAIQEWIRDVSQTPVDSSGLPPQICVIELGGTVGDIESMPFIEALRQLQYNVGTENFMSVFVSLVPELGVVGEQKTKPTQHGVKNLTSMGLSPSMIVCRSERPLLPETKKKLGLFCQVPPEAVVSVHDVRNTYRIAMMLQEQGACNLLIKCLRLVWRLPTLLSRWNRMALSFENCRGTVKVVLVGKYTNLTDSYVSVVRALQHAAMATERKLHLLWVESSDLEPVPLLSVEGKQRHDEDEAKHAAAWATLHEADGVLVPGGFGNRGSEGKMLASKYARESGTPFLGICLGMQLAAVEIARSKLGMGHACSAEWDQEYPNEHIVVYMPEIDKTKLGGTMRLGARKTILRDENCLSAWLYGGIEIMERHRHRYEINPRMVKALEKDGGVRFVGQDETGMRMEIMEGVDHPFFYATQYHPEYKTRAGRPSPPFLGFLMACAKLPLDRESVRRSVEFVLQTDPWGQDGSAMDVIFTPLITNQAEPPHTPQKSTPQRYTP
ncbi:CTP synthase [Porphyridium purpureum]|uniref:CTP synthase n=1 Tax=Porphyridium purpureum TaxID=35688 RepID=A0A5J4YRI7_PORPP|nr:CTP synthase [Porphyridium purpureum]|eukprot:POR2881..scf229_5